MLKIGFFSVRGSLIFWYGRLKAQEVSASDSYPFTFTKNSSPFSKSWLVGGLYADSPRNFDGHPFFETRVCGNGVLRINEVNYEGFPYSMTAKQIGFNFHSNPQSKNLIQIGGKVDEFELQDVGIQGTFKGMNPYTHHSNGFYEIIFGWGDQSFWAKHPQRA